MNTLLLLAIRCFLVFTTAAAFSLAQPAKANLITNGGFETGDFTGWDASDGISFVTGTINGIAPHSGSFQAVFPPPLTGLIIQSVATTPGASYTIHFSLAHTGSGQSFVNSFFGDVRLLVLVDQPPFGYTEFTFTATAATASTPLDFGYFQNEEGEYILDDVSVTPAAQGVPDAGSTLPLLGFAVLSLATLRRKFGC